MNLFKRQLISACLLFTANGWAQNASPVNFLILKPGDPGAAAELAGDYLATVANYFTAHTPYLREKIVHGWIANHPDSALAIMKQHPPVMAYVPAGFYFKHLLHSGQAVVPVAQAPRFGKTVERYYIVAAKSGPASLNELKGKIVRTSFGIDWDYLRKLVFPAAFRPGVFFKLEESQNLADDLFLLIESAEKKQAAPAALLLDEELKHFFEADDLVWPQLKIIWTSPELPRELFVVIGDDWSASHQKGLLESLQQMSRDPKGKELLELMQSSGFTPVDFELLNRLQEKYFSTPKVVR